MKLNEKTKSVGEKKITLHLKSLKFQQINIKNLNLGNSAELWMTIV